MKNPRVSRRKEILKIRAEINAKETKETIAKIHKAKSWFFERINKTDKPLATLIKKQREKDQINKIRIENGNTSTQNLWDTVKAVLRGKFIATQAYLKKQEKCQINNLTLHIKQLEKEEMKNPRVEEEKKSSKLGQKSVQKKQKRP